MARNYIICEWAGRELHPTLIDYIRRSEDLSENEAFETFRGFVNDRLYAGDRIIHITHKWNYEFDGKQGRYALYMSEVGDASLERYINERNGK